MMDRCRWTGGTVTDRWMSIKWTSIDGDNDWMVDSDVIATTLQNDLHLRTL
jgi:hypothetical protein